jgi:hypothetical protein
VVNEDLVHAVEKKIRENRWFTIASLSLHFPQISWSILHKIVSDELKFWKLCARWVPKMLTEEHKLKQQANALEFLTWYSEEGNNSLTEALDILSMFEKPSVTNNWPTISSKFPLEPSSYRGQDMGVARNPWIEAAVHGLEAHFIANKDEIQADHFNSEDHVHIVLGQ